MQKYIQTWGLIYMLDYRYKVKLMKYLRLILFRLKLKDGSTSEKTEKQTSTSTDAQIVDLMTKLDGQEARNVSSV